MALVSPIYTRYSCHPILYPLYSLADQKENKEIMCGRSSLSKNEKELEKRFGATFYSDELFKYNPLPNYNVAPSHFLPVITNEDISRFRPVRWGLIPSWAKDEKIGYKMINARIETLFEKSSFKQAVQKRRCIVPADGFYEWKKSKGPDGKIKKQPYLIKTTDQEIFGMAAIWERWKNPEGQTLFSFSIITQPPNELMQDIHNRMPAILTKDQEALWLSDDVSPEALVDMIQPYPSEDMKAYLVSPKVGNVRNNSADLIEEHRPDMTNGMLELF